MDGRNRVRKFGRLLLIVPILVAGLAVAGVRPAAAATLSCTTSYSSTTIKTPVNVPAGANCSLSGVIVQGGVTVEPGGILTVSWNQNLTEIRGNVVANGATHLGMFGGVTIRGNVTSSGSSTVALIAPTIRGNVTISGPTSSCAVTDSTITGSLVISGNTTVAGATVASNSIKINLICDNNTPAPIASSNEVGNQNIGQCSVGG